MTRYSFRYSTTRLFVSILTVASSIAQSGQPNYEPPQPSAEFGTLEATAKIAANAQALDIVGIKIGMSAKAAQDAAKAHSPNLQLAPQYKFTFESLPGTVITPVYSGQAKTADGGTDYIGVLLTTPPNAPLVYGVWRDLSFGKQESRPTIDYLVSGLRKKYGQESVADDSLLLWVFNAQRQQVMGAKAREIWQKCANQWGVGSFYDQTTIMTQMTKGFYGVSDGKDYLGGICHSHSLVQARYLADQPAGASQPLVMDLKISISNQQLHASGVTATYALLTQDAAKLDKKKNDEASKRAAPKF